VISFPRVHQFCFGADLDLRKIRGRLVENILHFAHVITVIHQNIEYLLEIMIEGSRKFAESVSFQEMPWSGQAVQQFGRSGPAKLPRYLCPCWPVRKYIIFMTGKRCSVDINIHQKAKNSLLFKNNPRPVPTILCRSIGTHILIGLQVVNKPVC